MMMVVVVAVVVVVVMMMMMMIIMMMITMSLRVCGSDSESASPLWSGSLSDSTVLFGAAKEHCDSNKPGLAALTRGGD